MKKLLLPTLITTLFTGPAFALTDAELQAAMAKKLEIQLENKEAAQYTAQFIMNNLLTWKGEELPLSEADSILAYAFGNRLLPNGNQVPGPMNEALADTVVEIYNQTGKPVYAQWEIAQSIGDRIPAKDLHSINPVIAKDGTLTYLSTIGVAQTAVDLAGGDLGKTVVVGFYEHSLRTINTSKDFGIDAYAPQGIELPHDYDSQSGQAWTRDVKTFIMHEVRNRGTNERTRLIEEAMSKAN
ncbi:hypothetical protein L1D13_21425 [Vibrio tubiashii]|uniref:hypothetical protein n=1 Tax=Vibrio tubiashii TaxID=29498 RepID=UPI001EFC3FD9|nr:hypothetical protein [Vibrio tubiashii]MCG9582711.1 hypothetical protein [Vibrio tubiashii]MCG9616304.1 hypothetical protein [Vibrio tubiashii]MCG9689473.1 hypothetical protein [Vibrio tubiashii]